MKKKATFIVAEISANHGHDVGIVKKTMLEAKRIGCDAVKIQTYRPDTITLDCDNEYFQINTGTIWDGTTLYKLYEDAYLPWEWHKDLFEFARQNQIQLFSTPFDPTAVDLLEECGNPIYKIASFEITDIPLIKYAASMGKPMLISTGIATLEEIGDAVNACRDVGNHQITLLKCTSEYPARFEDANLATMLDMKRRFGTDVGISDHTTGDVVALAAVAMGAAVLEKHFILDRAIGGPDASFSMMPDEFQSMVATVRNVEKTLGSIEYQDAMNPLPARKYARSLFVVKDVRAGETITGDNVRSIRPGSGMPPKRFEQIIGKRFSKDVHRGIPLGEDMIEGD